MRLGFRGLPFLRQRRRKRDLELDEEIASHLALAERERVARGEPASEAAAAAARELGNVGLIKEITREQWGGVLPEQLAQDARYGLRVLRRSPGFTAVAVAALSLGIGANTAIFSVVDGVLLRPLPFPDSSRIMAIVPMVTRPVRGDTACSYPDFFDWRAQSRSFSAMASRRGVSMTLTGVASPTHLSGQMVTSDFFRVLNVAPALGRGFLPDDDRPGTRVVVLSHALWESTFGADPSIVGKSIGLQGTPYVVIGVAPKGFQFPLNEGGTVDFYTSVAVDAEGTKPFTQNRGLSMLLVIGRLKPGVELAAANAEMRGIVKRLARQYPDDDRDQDEVRVVSELEQMVGRVRTPLYVLLAAVGCVLLIACANVANLLLARATARHRELALRTALGAARPRILRQLLTESLLLSLLGGAAGLVLALGGLRVLVRLSPSGIPRLAHIALDARILAFTLGVALLTGILFGIAPALRLTRADLNESLKEGGRGAEGGAGPGQQRVRSLLVVSETAIAVVLLTGAGLLLGSFERLRSVSPGFTARNVLTFDLNLPEPKYTEIKQRQFYDALLASIRGRAGVRSASAIFPIPMGDSRVGFTFTIEGRPVSKADEPVADFRQIAPDYFRTLGIPLLEGREFTARDDANAPPAVIVNAAFAKRYFPGERALHKRMTPGVAREGTPPVREIIGVVGDVRARDLGTEARPELYVSYEQLSIANMTTVVRLDGNPRGFAGDARSLVAAIDKDVPVYQMRTLEDYVFATLEQPRFNALLLSLFAGIALVLTAVGLYGVLAYAVAVRTREIVIRMALGARRADILGMIVRRGLSLALSGLVIGVAAALALLRLLQSLLFQVAPSDPATYGAAALLLTLVAALASGIPAYRATRLNPTEALRGE